MKYLYKGSLVMVSQGQSGKWGTYYCGPNGKLKRLTVICMPMTEDKTEAQHNLDVWADYMRLNPVL